MQLGQTPVLVREGAVRQRIQRPAKQRVLPIDRIRIIGIPDPGQLFHGGAEDIVVLQSGFLDDLHVGTVKGAQGHRAVEHQLHIAGAGGFRAGRGDLLGYIRGGNDLFRPGAVVVLDKDDLQTLIRLRIVVDPVGNHVDPVNHGFGPIIAGSRLGAEDEGDRGQILELAMFELIIDGEDAQGVHELPLVFVQAFDLDIEHHGRIQRDVLLRLNFRGQLPLLFILDGDEPPAELVIDHGLQVLQLIEIRDEPGTDLLLQEAGKLGIAQAEPAALGDAVGLVLEAFRPDFVPLPEQIVLQDFAVQRGNAVGCMGGIDRQLGHMNPLALNDAQMRAGRFAELLHIRPEAGIDLPHDGYDLRTDGAEQGKIPLFERFLHDGVIRVGEGFPGDPEGFLEGNPVFAQQADQLRDRHGGMGVVQLGGNLPGKEGVIAAMAGTVSAQDILHGGGDQHILLLDPHLAAGFPGVVGIEELGNVFRLILGGGGFGVFLVIEQGKVDLMKAFCLPQTQGADVFCTISDDRHVIGNSQHIPGLHGDHHRLILPADGPRIAPAGPVIRLLRLPAFDKLLFEQPVAEPQPVTGQRDAAGDGAVQKAGGQPAEAAVAEGIILDILQNGEIDAPILQRLAHVIQQPHAVQIVVNKAAHQVFHGKIVGLPMGKPGILPLLPQRGNGIHRGAGNGIVELGCGSLLQGLVGFGHQPHLGIADQLCGVHHGFISSCSICSV